MNNPIRFRINTPRIVHETIDGEAVIIDFESGTYYSLRYAGVDVWNLISSGATLPEMLNLLVSRYEVTAEEMESAISDLVGSLEKESLIVPADQTLQSVPHLSNGEKIPFKKPVLEKFTDMQELLLLDPIHEVDETGWPSPNR